MQESNAHGYYKGHAAAWRQHCGRLWVSDSEAAVALTGQRVDKLFEMVNAVSNQNSMRITTGMLNNILEDATARVQPPTDKGRRLKIYYMTQVGVKPPHFVIFCNDARLFHFSYQRYLENQIRAVFGLTGTPVKITIRQKGDKEEI